MQSSLTKQAWELQVRTEMLQIIYHLKLKFQDKITQEVEKVFATPRSPSADRMDHDGYHSSTWSYMEFITGIPSCLWNNPSMVPVTFLSKHSNHPFPRMWRNFSKPCEKYHDTVLALQAFFLLAPVLSSGDLCQLWVERQNWYLSSIVVKLAQIQLPDI